MRRHVPTRTLAAILAVLLLGSTDLVLHRAQQSRWVQLALADPAILIQHLDRNTTLLTIFWLTLMAASSALLVAYLGQLILGVD